MATGSCSFSYSSGLAYSPATNVASSNNVYASATHCSCCDANTNCLQLTNFGFTIPSTAVITGIKVDIERRAPVGSQVQDNGLRLLKAGVEVGNNLAVFGLNWISTDAYASYGGCNNLWGATWTPADINASNFGLVFASINYSCSGNVTSLIDHVRVTVCYNTSLPVSLTAFDAQQQDDAVAVKWSTASEWENSYFVIEHSVNGDDYHEIGTVEGKNIAGENDYRFIHENPLPGLNYYRLVQRDHDGRKEIFGPAAVDFTSEKTFGFSASWHNDQLVIDGQVKKNGTVGFTVYNLTGQAIYTTRLYLQPGNGHFILTMPAFPKGVYIISAQPEKGEMVNRKIMKNE